MIILDTDAITFLEHQQSATSKKLRDRLSIASAEHRIVTTIVTYDEQTRGWIARFSKARSAEEVVEVYARLLRHVEIYCEMEIVPLTLDCERRYRQLRAAKVRIGTHDLRIAAIALESKAILYSRNLGDFRQVPGLAVVDWMQD